MNYFWIFTMNSNADAMSTEQNQHGGENNMKPHDLQPDDMYSGQNRRQVELDTFQRRWAHSMRMVWDKGRGGYGKGQSLEPF